jgi:TonB family protein
VALNAQNGVRAADATTNPSNILSENAPVPDSTALELARSTLPAYPLEVEDQKLQGQVMLKADVSETGTVDSATVISGDPKLAQAAVDAVKQWTFKPFIRSGKAIRISTNLSFDFMFRDKDSEKAHLQDSLARGAPSRPQSGSYSIRVVWIAHDLATSLKVKEVVPVYPPAAKSARLQGTAALFALIGKDGAVRQVSLISGHPLLAQSSIEAVKQWRYKPYLLDNEATAVQTKVTVIFSLRY